MRSLLSVLPVFLLLAAGCARSVEMSQPQETVRLYSGPLAPDVARFTTKLRNSMERIRQGYGIPGVSVALVDKGQLVWAAGYGWADEKNARPVTPETVFAVNSVSKAVTAWGVMALAEDGRLDLDAPIATYIGKSLRLPEGQDYRDVTVRRLLSHTSGISSVGLLPFAESPSDSLAGNTYSPMGRPAVIDHSIGAFRYSDHNFTILQLVIQRLTGRSFSDFMRTRVFEPLGMRSSGYDVTYELARASAIGQNWSGSFRNRVITEAVQAPGGMASSAADLGRFVAAHMTSGNHGPAGRYVIGEDSLRLMLTPVTDTSKSIRLALSDTSKHALGYRVNQLPSGDQLISQVDVRPGWTSLVAALPARGQGIVVLTNGDATGPWLYEHLLCEWLNVQGMTLGHPCSNLYDLYTVSVDNTGLARLTSDPGADFSPHWSADGGQITFSRAASALSAPGTYVARSDGSGEELLMPGMVMLALSPDGKHFIYESRQFPHGTQLYVGNFGNGERHLVTDGTGSAIFPAWSPDGSRVVFLRSESVGLWDDPMLWTPWIATADGTEAKELPGLTITPDHLSALPSALTWSPDGQRVALVVEHDIYVVSADDGVVTRLTTDGLMNRDPAWSPDGTMLAFSRREAGNSDIFVMNADGSERRLLVSHPADEIMPAWSPDGARIAFASNREPG